MREITIMHFENNRLIKDILIAYCQQMDEENADLTDENLCRIYNELLRDGKLGELLEMSKLAISFYGTVII
jgi:hypothetical protein